tara:strand:+ start:607 stop:873 length:267 start_codon:yes stop_codon:yes gene_type:complete
MWRDILGRRIEYRIRNHVKYLIIFPIDIIHDFIVYYSSNNSTDISELFPIGVSPNEWISISCIPTGNKIGSLALAGVHIAPISPWNKE